jgi:RNA polymerase sigma-70 factor, ECF subfamily
MPVGISCWWSPDNRYLLHCRQSSVHRTLYRRQRSRLTGIFAGFQGEQLEELLAWMRRILLNNAANTRRRFEQTAKRNVLLKATWEQATDAIVSPNHDPPTPCSRLISLEQRGLVEQAIAQLPAPMRRAIELRNKEHLSFTEIGEQLECSPAAARKLWARAIERLRQMLLNDHDQR